MPKGEGKLIALSKRLGIENQIHFLGYRNDIKELLQAVDIFLFTSLQEGLARSLMEAMASGLPCIVSNIRGNVDLLEDGRGGFLVPIDEVDAIADKIRILLSDEGLRKKMSECNLMRIKEFDTERVKKIIGRIYKKELQ